MERDRFPLGHYHRFRNRLRLLDHGENPNLPGTCRLDNLWLAATYEKQGRDFATERPYAALECFTAAQLALDVEFGKAYDLRHEARVGLVDYYLTAAGIPHG